jgi:hypothetical protein
MLADAMIEIAPTPRPAAWQAGNCSTSIRKSPYCSQSKKIFLLLSFLAGLTDRRPGAS